MPDQWRVLKFGGTSVAGLPQWEAIAELAAARSSEGSSVLIVCSALAGVTDTLEALCESAADQDSKISRLLERHRSLAFEMGVDSTMLLDEGGARLREAATAVAQVQSPENKAALMSIGEWLSSRLGALYLARSMDAGWVDACEALRAMPEDDPDGQRAWLSARCEAGADSALADRWLSVARVLVTQGYVAGAQDGRTVLLGRGGSDTSAALLASRLAATEVEIWTDVPGLFSADPALVPDALLINRLNYPEALEMAASGARVVHPRCIRVAADAGLDITIHDLSRPGLPGTCIASEQAISVAPPVQGVKAVTFQSGMLVMLLENLDTRQHVGFLAWVFTVFSRQGVSVDLVATSETTTTVAINGVDNHLEDSLVDRMSQELSARCKVRVYQDCCCVNLVGRGARLALAQMGPAAQSFREWPLLMLSQSANDMCLSLLVYPQHAEALLLDLHRSLVTEADISKQTDVYGPCWKELEPA